MKRRKLNRLKNYNYSDAGWYFVTICSKDKENIFGEYKNIVGAGLQTVSQFDFLILNEDFAPLSPWIPAFAGMTPSRLSFPRKRESTLEGAMQLRHSLLVSARNNINLSRIGKIIDQQWNNISNQYGNVIIDEYLIMPNHMHGIIIIDNWNAVLSRADARPAPTLSDIISSFKSKSTNAYLNHLKQNNIQMPAKIWQRSFYDHIIRNDHCLNAIREYISSNPVNWEQDIDNLIKKGGV